MSRTDAPESWVPELDSDNDGITDGNEFIFGSNPKVADTQDFTLMIPGLYEAPNRDLFLEISYDRPAGAQRRKAFYNAYLTDHLPASDAEWRPGIFTVADISNITPDLERVTMRSTFMVADADNLFARIGGGIPGFLPPPGLTPDNPLPDPGDLTLERGNVGKVIYYRLQGDETSNGGSVIGGPQYYDRSSLKRTVVHAGAVPDTDYPYVVKVTIMEGLTDYVGSSSNGVTSSSLPDGPDTPGPEAGSVSYTVEPVTANLVAMLAR